MWHHILRALLLTFIRLDDVEAKLIDTEREADKARKDSKTAREQFNDIKKRRCVRFMTTLHYVPCG